jgi:hypothetical protein
LCAGCAGGSSSGGGDGGVNTGCFAGLVKFDGICLTAPTVEAQRTACGDVTEYCDPAGTKTPSLACLTGPAKMHPATPATVTLTGFIHPFSGGKSNAPALVQVFKASDLAGGADPTDATKVTPIASIPMIGFDPTTATDPTQFRACDVDKTIGCVPTTPAACQAPTCFDGLSGRADHMQYCRTVNGQGVCSNRFRWEPRYSLDGIPTNTPLVIRTTGATGGDVWRTLVAWNVFLASDDKSCGGDPMATDCLDTSDMAHPKYQLNINIISKADYDGIPMTAGLAGGISPTEGGVAGEIHDCDNIRIGNAQVGVQPAGDRLTYFNGNPYDTVPDSGRSATGTDQLGLYASLNVNPGPVVVEAVGLVGGQQVSLGKFSAYVYASSVAVVNINGGKPVQQP